jgi:hypothetical protein
MKYLWAQLDGQTVVPQIFQAPSLDCTLIYLAAPTWLSQSDLMLVEAPAIVCFIAPMPSSSVTGI